MNALEIGTKVLVQWGNSYKSEKELGEIISLPTPRTWQVVKFEDGITMEVPRYMMERVR